MPEFMSGYAGGGVVTTLGAVEASTEGTALTSGGANTKGAWVELSAATPFDTHWISIWMGNGTAQLSLLDIGIGAATEQVIIPDLSFQTAKAAGHDSTPYQFPIFIPKGSRVTARFQALSATQVTQVVVHLCSGSLFSGGPGPTHVTAYGSVASSNGTNIDPGAVANTDSSWVEIAAATERDHRWLVVGGVFGDGVLAADVNWMVDIGIGEATEQELISNILYTADTNSDATTTTVRGFPVFIPKGSRLTARARSSVTTNGDRDIWLKLYGC